MFRTMARGRFTFLIKLLGAAALIGLADLLFYGEEPGWTLGAFALAWAAVLAAVRPDLRRNHSARVTLIAAALFGLALVDDPDPLDWCLFWVAIASATLLPLHRFTDAIRWAGDLLEAVLTTLVENSAQAGARKVSIEVRAGPEVTINVMDDGSGIAPADRARIFEPFFTSRRASGGSGLGLPIARSLLAATGGDLRLLDTTAGTAFQLRLAVHPSL